MILPRIRIVGERKDNNNASYFVAGTLEDAVGDEEDIVAVGIYQFLNKRRVVKRIVAVKPAAVKKGARG